MTNANDCAYPADSTQQTEGGLTKREYFAAMAMQGIATHSWEKPDNMAVIAVQYADALIAELNRTP